MRTLFVLVPILCGAAFFGIVWGLERVTRRPGLTFLITGLAQIGIAAVGFTQGYLLLSLLFLLQAIGFLYFARWRWLTGRTERAVASEPHGDG